jgi:hypothetical protein
MYYFLIQLTRTFKFLIDTGANVSLIKTDKVKQTPLCFNPNDKITINGISRNKSIQTAESVYLEPIIDNHEFKIKFHIIERPTNIPFAGLIGNDFLQSKNAEINLEQFTLKIKSLPFPLKIYRNSEFVCTDDTLCSQQPNKNDNVILKPRSETLIRDNIINQNKISEGITPEIKIYNGVFIAKAILKVNNKKVVTSVINTTDKFVKII